jgi:catechol 2,3-dioxygenase-like lactoylglutathione lyase family enzyme
MLHHISIGVSDITASGAFYDAILEPLGYVRVFEDLRPGERYQAIGYGSVLNEDVFTIKERFAPFLHPGPGFHLAFAAPSRNAVSVWHERGMAMGGVNRGDPREWVEFGSDYYAAYLTDRDGWQIEAVHK